MQLLWKDLSISDRFHQSSPRGPSCPRRGLPPSCLNLRSRSRTMNGMIMMSMMMTSHCKSMIRCFYHIFLSFPFPHNNSQMIQSTVLPQSSLRKKNGQFSKPHIIARIRRRSCRKYKGREPLIRCVAFTLPYF